MLLSGTSFWQHALVQHLYLYQLLSALLKFISRGVTVWEEAWGVVATLCNLSALRDLVSVTEIAASSWFNSVLRRSLHRTTATHQTVPTPLCPVQTTGQGVSYSSEHGTHEKACDSPFQGKWLLCEGDKKALPATPQEGQAASVVGEGRSTC